MRRIKSWAGAILYPDLSKAFDMAIRKLVMGAMEGSPDDPDLKSLVIDLGLPAEHAQELEQYIKQKRSLLEQMCADGKVVELVKSLHSFSWL